MLEIKEFATDLATGTLGLQVDAAYLAFDFAAFLRQSWHVIEPSTELEWGPHLDAMCMHLEAVARSLDRKPDDPLSLRNLVVTIPPGCTKSITIMVAFPAWVWTWRPGTRFLCASNDGELAIRDAVACRRLIESDWYRERWAAVFELTTDQNTKGMYENSRRGYRSTTTVGSKVVGKKGDILLCCPRETQLLTAAGPLSIGDIVEKRIACEVASFNHLTGLIEYRSVSAYYRSPPASLIEIGLADGRVIRCTDEHPVFVVGKGYVPAATVQECDEVLADEDVPVLRSRD